MKTSEREREREREREIKGDELKTNETLVEDYCK